MGIIFKNVLIIWLESPSIEQSDKLEQTAATYRKLMTAMARDPRVIVIKLADRVHNMRTLQYMSAEKRKRISQETLDLYAPLTYRFGLYKLKVEFLKTPIC